MQKKLYESPCIHNNNNFNGGINNKYDGFQFLGVESNLTDVQILFDSLNQFNVMLDISHAGTVFLL